MFIVLSSADGPGNSDPPSRREIRLEWRGRFSSKVQLAETFRAAYQVLDGLSQPELWRRFLSNQELKTLSNNFN